MSRRPHHLGLLRALLWALVASSVLHYGHNLLFFEQYPEPPWIHRHHVDAFWWLMTPLAWVGYRLIRNGSARLGAATLMAYAACNLLTLGHYRYAPPQTISLQIHLFILLEAALAILLMAALLVSDPKSSSA